MRMGRSFSRLSRWTVAEKVVSSLSTRSSIEVAIGNRARISDRASRSCVPPSAITRAASEVIPACPCGSSTAPVVKRSATVTIGFWLGGSARTRTSFAAAPCAAGASAAVRTSAGAPASPPALERGLAVNAPDRSPLPGASDGGDSLDPACAPVAVLTRSSPWLQASAAASSATAARLTGHLPWRSSPPACAAPAPPAK